MRNLFPGSLLLTLWVRQTGLLIVGGGKLGGDYSANMHLMLIRGTAPLSEHRSTPVDPRKSRTQDNLTHPRRPIQNHSWLTTVSAPTANPGTVNLGLFSAHYSISLVYFSLILSNSRLISFISASISSLSRFRRSSTSWRRRSVPSVFSCRRRVVFFALLCAALCSILLL